jgi:transcriptional regulator with XRE-family HTH domain
METTGRQTIRSIRQAGAALKARRKARGLTQAALAERAGAAQSSISEIETGVVVPGLDTYLRLLEVLDADLSVADRAIDESLI